MIASIALSIILLFGIAISLVCLYGVAAPRQLISHVMTFWNQPGGWMTAILIRVLLGLNLIFAAQESKFPMTFAILGGIAILAAIVILLTGKGPIDRMLAWVERFPALVLRIWLLIGLGFGAFLIYASL